MEAGHLFDELSCRMSSVNLKILNMEPSKISWTITYPWPFLFTLFLLNSIIFRSTFVLSSESGLCSVAFKDVITIRRLLFGSTFVYTGKIIHSIFINCSKFTLLSLMNIQLKIHTVFCEHKQSPQTPLMNYAKKQKLFSSLRKNSLTLDLSSHHQNSFRFLTISFNFLKLNVPKYSQIW